MDNIPVDESNRKYTTPSEPIVESSSEEVEVVNDKKLKTKTSQKDSSKNRDKGKLVLAKLQILRAWIARKVEEFKKVQYPYLYAKFYDMYHFELVGYKPLDIALKVLIIITILIVLAILMVVVREIIKLAI